MYFRKRNEIKRFNLLLSLAEMNGLLFYDIVTAGLIVVELVETSMIMHT